MARRRDDRSRSEQRDFRSRVWRIDNWLWVAFVLIAVLWLRGGGPVWLGIGALVIFTLAANWVARSLEDA